MLSPHYQPTQPHHWALIGGHLWRATKHGAYRKDCHMPDVAHPKAAAWFDGAEVSSLVGRWLAIPEAPAEHMPYPARLEHLFQYYRVRAGPFPRSATLLHKGEPIAFVMAATLPLGGPCITPTGQPWPQGAS